MDNFWRRFPLASKIILRNLDDQSLAISKEACREINEFERIFFIKIIEKYNSHFKGFEESWNLAINKSQIKNIQQLARAIQEFFKLNPYSEQISPLHIAAARGNFHLCEYIIGKIINKNPAGKLGQTPLHFAARKGNLDICRLIIEKVQNKNPGCNFKMTPLHFAASYGFLEICEFIISRIKDKNPADSIKWTPLHRAAMNGHLGVCKLIIGKQNFYLKISPALCGSDVEPNLSCAC